MTERFDVAVVGYGPVGMAMATLLGQAGHSVVVLERYAGLYNLPRAAIFDDETMRTFARLGISTGLLPKIHAQPNYEWRNADGELLIEHDFAAFGRSGWAEWYHMYQPHLEDALDAACRKTGKVEVRFDSPVDGYERLDDGVLVSSGSKPVSARFVIACDGGNSFTRHWLRIQQDDHGFSEPWMVCDFELTATVTLPMARQVCDPKQPISIISLGPGHHRFSFMLDSVAAFETDRAPEKVWARVARYLTPEQARLIRVATYTFESKVAQRWRDGRIFLAGDAAHQMPPFLGQGMCSGIRDAVNLAFKLDPVLRGQLDEAVLDTYQSERSPQVRGTIEKGIALGKVQTMRDPVAAAARDAGLLANRRANKAPEKIRLPGLGPGLLADGTPGAGELFPQAMVGSLQGPRRFDEVHGYGWILLGTDAVRRALESDHHRLLDLIGILDAPGANGTTRIDDLQGVYRRWLVDHRAASVIVRPDFHVFGTAPDDASLTALLAQLPRLGDDATRTDSSEARF